MNNDEQRFALTLRHEDGETTSNLREKPYTMREIESECVEWTEQGDWRTEDGDGCEVEIEWVVTDEDGDEVDSGTHTVQIPHNEKIKVTLAGGDHRCFHEWERDDRVGCAENPGVMGLSGTAISVTDICSECGLVRSTRHNGSQRNPGQPETEVSYTQLSALDNDDEEAAQ